MEIRNVCKIRTYVKFALNSAHNILLFKVNFPEIHFNNFQHQYLLYLKKINDFHAIFGSSIYFCNFYNFCKKRNFSKVPDRIWLKFLLRQHYTITQLMTNFQACPSPKNNKINTYGSSVHWGAG